MVCWNTELPSSNLILDLYNLYCIGLVISAVCSHETTAIQFAIGSFYPAIVLSG